MACSTSDLLIPTRDFYCTFSLCEFLCVHGNKACVCVSANKRGLIGDNGRHCQMSIKSCSFSLSLVCLSRDTYMTAQTSEPSFFLRTSVFFFCRAFQAWLATSSPLSCQSFSSSSSSLSQPYACGFVTAARRKNKRQIKAGKGKRRNQEEKDGLDRSVQLQSSQFSQSSLCEKIYQLILFLSSLSEQHICHYVTPVIMM